MFSASARLGGIRIAPAMLLVGLTLSIGCALALGLLSPTAQAVVTCDQIAALNGDDSNPGTLGAPLKTPQALVDSLASGETGCLRTGSFAQDDQIVIETEGITLASYPGERARLKGRLWITSDGDGTTIASLDLDGRYSNPDPTGPVVNADGVTFIDNDVTNYDTGICLVLGNTDYGTAEDTNIDSNRIHNCGDDPNVDHDRGHEHGIYVEESSGTEITNNLIYDNSGYGIHHYPDGDETYSANNVIDGNGAGGVIFGGEATMTPDDNTVTANAITNSVRAFNVESSWNDPDPPGDPSPVGTGNQVDANCLYASALDDPGNYYNANGGVGDQVGFSAADNTIAGEPFSDPPIYVDRSNWNLHIRSDSDCQAIVGDPAASNTRWEAPSPLSSGGSAGQDALWPDVAIGPDGTAAAVWRWFDGANWILQANVREPGGSWGSVEDLTASGQDVSDANVEVAGDGTVVAAWRRFDGASWRSQARVRATDGTWGSTTTLSGAGQDAIQPDLGVADSGESALIWRRSDGSKLRTQAVVRSAGGSWGSVTTLSAAGQDVEHPRVAVGDDGLAIAAWRRFDGTNWRIQTAARPSGGSWSSVTTLSAAGSWAWWPEVEIGDDGSAVAVWQRAHTGGARIEASVRSTGGVWGSAALLSASGQAAEEPSVGVAADGSAIAVWRRSNGANFVAQASARPPGGPWSAATNLSASGADATSPRVALGDDGNAIALWTRLDSTADSSGGFSRVEAAERAVGSSWSAASRISSVAPASAAANPRVAIGSGRSVGAWQLYNGTVQRIYYGDYWF